MVRMKGLEPTRLAAQEPKSCMSTNSITSAYLFVAISKTAPVKGGNLLATDYITTGYCCQSQTCSAPLPLRA